MTLLAVAHKYWMAWLKHGGEEATATTNRGLKGMDAMKLVGFCDTMFYKQEHTLMKLVGFCDTMFYKQEHTLCDS